MSTIGRTTGLQASQQLLFNLTSTQAKISDAQNAISTGIEIRSASDDPTRTASILLLQAQLEEREQVDRSLQNASALLNSADAAVGDVTDILIESQSLGLEALSNGLSPDILASQSEVVEQQLAAIVNIANRTVQEIPLFGGGDTGTEPFVPFLGGVRYVGGQGAIQTDVGLDERFDFNANGDEVFGALASRIEAAVDLNPNISAATRIADVNGAQREGVRLGTIAIDVNGSEALVDLAGADSIGDIITRINEAIDGQTGTVGSVGIDSANGGGLELTAAAGQTLSIRSLGNAQTAEDLGIATSVSGGTVSGGDIDARLTRLTNLSDLGSNIDLSGGLKISQGAQTRIADFSNAQTVQDLLQEVESLDLGIRAQINPEGTAIDFFNDVSGLELSIGENNGGTTAGDLGIRSFGLTTRLEDFRNGAGVETAVGNDIELFLHDGRSFEVDIDGASNAAEVLEVVRDAATAAGVAIGLPGDTGTELNIGFALDGNGFAFEDLTTGTDDFKITDVNDADRAPATTAAHLGININAGQDSEIIGEDQTKVRVESVFTHLALLRDSLVVNDQSGIAVATSGIEQDVDNTARARANIGIQARRVEDQIIRSSELRITEEQFLSEIRDTDTTEAITRFNQLVLQLQASLQVGSTQFQLNLLDFLR